MAIVRLEIRFPKRANPYPHSPGFGAAKQEGRRCSQKDQGSSPQAAQLFHSMWNKTVSLPEVAHSYEGKKTSKLTLMDSAKLLD